jgi:hypothetical protein
VLSSNFISASPLNPNLLRAFLRRAAPYAISSLLVLVPCFWQSRVQAGDMGSHLYNAWLAGLIERGQAPGLVIASQTTNVLFDLLLAKLLPAVGAAAAERVAAALAVLVFFWGAFAFCAAACRRSPWNIAPVLAMLAYGWVFHIGFFNFYLSVGLCFFAVAQIWNGRSRGWLVASPLLGIAYLAHALPVVWAAGIFAFAWLWRGLNRRSKAYLFGTCLAVLVLLHAAIVIFMRARWYTYQIWHITGADQLWVFGAKYEIFACALAAVWLWMAFDRPRQTQQLSNSSRDLSNSSRDRKGASGSEKEASVLGVIAALSAAAVFLIPNAIWLPQYQHQLAYVSERMSLPIGVVVCAWLAGASARRWQSTALVILCLVFFAVLYADEAKLNRFEDEVDALVAQLPPNQRVVLSVLVPDSQVSPVDHMVDRACIGRCLSYANYEPSSGQFRIRVAGPTTLVAPTETESGSLQYGSYIVKPDDPPLVQIQVAPDGRLGMRVPPPGRPLGVTIWEGF